MATTDEPRLAPSVGSDEHKTVLEHALQRVRQAQAAHDVMIPEWKESYLAFRALPGKSYPASKERWQTDYRPPYVQEQVNTMLPRMVEGRPTPEVLRADPSTTWAQVKAQKQYLQYAMWQDAHALKSARLALTALIFNHGWSKQGFLHQKVTRDVLLPTGRREERELTIAARPTRTIGHPFDVMGDPFSPTLEMARYVVWRTMSTVGQVQGAKRRKVRTKDGVVRWAGRYENTDEVTPFGKQLRENTLPNDLRQWVPEHVSVRCKGQAVEILEVLDRETDRIYTIANRQIVLRDQRMPWMHGQLPVALAITSPDIGTMLGISKVPKLGEMQSTAWMREQQVIDNARLQTDLVLLIRDTVLNMEDYQLAPGAKWPVENMDDVQALQYPQPQLASQQDLEMYRGRMQAYSGTAYMTGADPGSMGMDQNTASGLLAILEEGNRGVDFAMNMFRLAEERALQQMLSDGAQYLSEPQFVPGAQRGQDPIEVSPEMLAAKSSVRVTLGSETGVKSLKQQMVQGLMQAFSAFEPGTPIPTPQGPKVISRLPILEALAEAYDRDPEDFLVDMQQEQAVAAPTDPAAMLAAAQEAGANPGVVMPGMPAAGAPSDGVPVGGIVAA